MSLTSLDREQRRLETKLSLLTVSRRHFNAQNTWIVGSSPAMTLQSRHSSLSPPDHQAGSGLAANRALRLSVLALQPSHEFGDRLHGFDRADALPASPDIAPSLRFCRTAGGGEAHRLRLAIRQAVRVKA